VTGPAQLGSMDTDARSVFVFACLVAALVLISAYATDRNGSVDELGFLNPPYMLAHFGRLTFPVFPFNGFFDVPVITHPPVHLLWIGLLWRLGFSIYYAEATPTVLLMLLSIVIIVRSAFPAAVKLGWLFGIGYLAASWDTITLIFGSRPEGEIQAAWFCGLLLLESGRIESWNRFKLGAGAFFLVWASGTHYYAGPAAAGIAVYLIWAIWKLGWKEAKPRVIAMCLGSCLFILPYLALYLIPYFREISSTIRNTVGHGGIRLSVERHLDLYRYWSREVYRPELIRKAMALRIPLLILSTAILAAIHSTRGAALAALPLQLGIFLLVWRKMPYYIVHECIFFASAIAIGLLTLGRYVLTHYPLAKWGSRFERAFAPVAVVVLSICLVKGSPMLADARLTLNQRVHEMELAHAVGQRMLGLHARVGGRWWGWYSSGAEHWYDVENDLHFRFLEFDLRTYMKNVEAIQVCSSSDVPGRPNSWYADGSLKLRGFYFAETNPTLGCVLLSPQGLTPLSGYAAANGQLYRFEQNDQGGYEVLSAVCQPGSDWNNPHKGVFATTLSLPEGPEAKDWLVTVLAPRSYLAPTGSIGRSCRQVSSVRGTLLLDDWKPLLEWSRRNSPSMHFYRDIDDMPGYAGMGLSPDAIPPSGLVPAKGVIVDMAAFQASKGARLERVPHVRITTIPGAGSFSAGVPVQHAETIAGPCWVVLKLRVHSGRIAFTAFDKFKGIIEKTKAIAPSPEPQSVALYVPDFVHTTDIVVFNSGSGAAVVDVFDVAVLVRPAQ
jgi:hypothetical protein